MNDVSNETIMPNLEGLKVLFSSYKTGHPLGLSWETIPIKDPKVCNHGRSKVRNYMYNFKKRMNVPPTGIPDLH